MSEIASAGRGTAVKPPPGEWLVGIDIGTSSVKAVAFDPLGSPIAHAAVAYGTRRLPEGVAEQDPHAWWDATCAAVSRLIGDRRPHVLAVGLTGQVGTHTLLSSDGEPLLPALTWQDSRSRVCLAVTLDLLGEDGSDYVDHRLPLVPSWPLPRLLYFSRAHPGLLGATTRLCQPKDFVGFQLTGELATDLTSLRGGVSQTTGAPLEALRKQGFDHLLPPVRQPTDLLGAVTPAASTACGLAAGTPVFIGLGDFNAALLGAGVTRCGQGFDIGGTSEHVGMLTDTSIHRPGIASLPPNELSAAFITYGVSSNGGSVLNWATRTLFPHLFANDLPDQLNQELANAVAHGPSEVLAVPYLDGERAPIWDDRATATLTGLRSHHTRWTITHALLDGVAFNLRLILDTISDQPADSVRGVGGTSRLPIWNQIKANALGRPILTMQESEAGTLGAAIAAAIGSRLYADPHTAISAMVRIGAETQPNPEAAEHYETQYRRFRNEVAERVRG